MTNRCGVVPCLSQNLAPCVPPQKTKSVKCEVLKEGKYIIKQLLFPHTNHHHHHHYRTLQTAASESEARAKKLKMDLNDVEERLRDTTHRFEAEKMHVERLKSEVGVLDGERERLDGERRAKGEWAKKVQEEIQAKTRMLDDIERLLRDEQEKDTRREAENLHLKQQLSAARDEVLSLQTRSYKQKQPVPSLSPPRAPPVVHHQIRKDNSFELGQLQERLASVETENQRLRKQREEQRREVREVRDMRDMRSDVREVRDVRDVRDVREVRDMRSEVRSDVPQYSHHPVHLPPSLPASSHASSVGTPLFASSAVPPRPVVQSSLQTSLHPTPLPSPALTPSSLPPPPQLAKAEQQIAQMTSDLASMTQLPIRMSGLNPNGSQPPTPTSRPQTLLSPGSRPTVLASPLPHPARQ